MNNTLCNAMIYSRIQPDPVNYQTCIETNARDNGTCSTWKHSVTFPKRSTDA